MNNLHFAIIAAFTLVVNTPVVATAASVVIREAPLAEFPGSTDSNSPSFWVGETFHIFSSHNEAHISTGPELGKMSEPAKVTFNGSIEPGFRWIEAVKLRRDGVLMGLYHREDQRGDCPGRPHFTFPDIGVAKSLDQGRTWQDLGIVLTDRVEKWTCENTPNVFFGGGVGDPSWAYDEASGYAYILYSSYSGSKAEQGIQIARIRLSDLSEAPVGNVWRWNNGEWNEPGIYGKGSSILPADSSWHSEHPAVFWGPSIHWNDYLKQYVVIMNRAKDKGWGQEGIFLSFVQDISDPNSWSKPELIFESGGWYPQIVGDPSIQGTDAFGGQVNRLLMHGKSRHTLSFEK